jgi:hypothetical protein
VRERERERPRKQDRAHARDNVVVCALRVRVRGTRIGHPCVPRVWACSLVASIRERCWLLVLAVLLPLQCDNPNRHSHRQTETDYRIYRRRCRPCHRQLPFRPHRPRTTTAAAAPPFLPALPGCKPSPPSQPGDFVGAPFQGHSQCATRTSHGKSRRAKRALPRAAPAAARDRLTLSYMLYRLSF